MTDVRSAPLSKPRNFFCCISARSNQRAESSARTGDPFDKAQTLEQAVRGLGIAHATSGAADVVTVSLGVAVANPANGEGEARLIACADGQLYRAKQSGRGTMRGCQLPAE